MYSVHMNSYIITVTVNQQMGKRKENCKLDISVILIYNKVISGNLKGNC